ncbi:MAG: nickel-responsive transcriptional regulator NikR [Betaproteobacteria bacterium]|nr:nickel-responsive transcriptional regulator NikR [Betaproteobacteria bacterium]
MERITISLDETLAQEFDDLIRTRGYGNRSEAVRDMIRAELEKHRLQTEQAPHCVASLSYVYDHHERRLAERLTDMQHHAHDLVVSSMHVHLDHDHCLESLFLRGPTGAVRAFAESLSAERGVRHGQLNLVPVAMDQASHPHRLISGHLHSRPRS